MQKIKLTLALALITALALTSCSDHKNVNETQNAPPTGPILAQDGITINSAIFSVYVQEGTDQAVDAFRITSDWDENTVTWNNFGGYDATNIGSFTADAAGYHSIDITTLVQDWVDGTYPNYGIILTQGTSPLTVYSSSEWADIAQHPRLVINYTTSEGTTEITVQRGVYGMVADSYIFEGAPDDNYGSSDILYTGVIENSFKKALFKFSLPEAPPPQEGCTRTIGYWKTHAGFGPQADVVTPLLPIDLGTSDGASTLHVTTALIAYRVLGQHYYGSPSNGITKLYAQLLGAKLNIENGADDTDIADVITAADNFLATHDQTSWTGLSSADKMMVLGWHDMLDNYNEGLIGPGHCDEYEDSY
jgi:hypothetical protein